MIIEYEQKVTEPRDNKIVGDIDHSDSTIKFKGKNNILFTDGTAELRNSIISFYGDGAVIFLTGNSKKPYSLKIDMWRETAAYFGADNYINGSFNAIVSERKNLVVGSGGAFSFGIWLRTADPHLVYSIENHKRTNPSKSILIGDHVWIGQNALLLKGSEIGSGSIVSANCVIAGKSVASNTIYAGNPGRMVKKEVFFRGNSVHNYTKEQTRKSQKYGKDDFIFTSDGHLIEWQAVDDMLTDATDAEARLEIIQQELACNTGKNRFYVGRRQSNNRFLRLLGRD